MDSFLFISFSVTVAAAIGAIANYLAIKMLFHPRKTLYVGKWKIPFTPGLIPKRKDDISRSLGHIVGEYLVTSEGLKRVLTEPAFKERLTRKLSDKLEEWSQREGTLEEGLIELLGEKRFEEVKRSLLQILDHTVSQGVRWLWEKQAIKEWPLERTVPGWSVDRREEIARIAAQYVVSSIQGELRTVNGDRIVRQLTAQFMDQAGGWFGALAGIFMDEQKTSAKIRQVAIERIQSPAIRDALEEMVRKRILEWEKLPLEDALRKVSKGMGVELLIEKLSQMIYDPRWLDNALQMQINSFSPQFEWVRGRLSGVISSLLYSLQYRLERIVQELNLPKMVEDQVADFPVERVEDIVLSVSGKEFRAITWLGALLGGMIGLGQSLFIRFFI